MNFCIKGTQILGATVRYYPGRLGTRTCALL